MTLPLVPMLHRLSSQSLAMKLNFWLYITASASALAGRLPHETRTTVARTASPASAITPPPAVHAELFKRAAATCGFIRGNSASPLTCPDGYNCATTAHIQQQFACCNSIECLEDWGICLSYGSQYNCQGDNLPASACSSIYGSILSCNSNAPNCYRYARSASRGAYLTQYSWACGSDTSDILVLLTATNGNQVANTAPVTVPGFSQAPQATGKTSTSSSSYNTTGTKSGLTTRGIILIALFGGGALFIVFIIGFVLCSRSRKNKRNLANSNYAPQPPLQPPQQPPQQYPPPMAMNGPPPGQAPQGVPMWNPVSPMQSQSNMVPVKPQSPVSMVHELTAPVRALHEMPGGQAPHAGGPGYTGH